MKEYNTYDPFSVCFNVMKMKYKDYDESLTDSNFLVQNDKINVFINLESVFKNLSMIQDLEKKVMLQRDFNILLVSNILNLAGHYKQFFVNNGLDTKVYIYHTDFDSTEFLQFKYNEDFRSYYLLKFNENPKFVVMTDKLKGTILPDVRTYSEFIPNVYYITGNNIDGSLVPLIIANNDSSRKNLMITGDFYETQNIFNEKFLVHYIHKNFGVNNIWSTIEGFLKDIVKDQNDVELLCKTFSSQSMYISLLCTIGDKIRSIDGLSGVGIKTLKKMIDYGIQQSMIKLSTTNPEMISKIFMDDSIKEEYKNNFYCISLPDMYNELTSSMKLSVLNQVIDRFDNNSLVYLNTTKFINHRLNLEALTC